MGEKFIILAPRSVVRAMSMNDLIMSALVPLGSGSLRFACMVKMSRSVQSLSWCTFVLSAPFQHRQQPTDHKK
jgi:hypothetical protein